MSKWYVRNRRSQCLKERCKLKKKGHRCLSGSRPHRTRGAHDEHGGYGKDVGFAQKRARGGCRLSARRGAGLKQDWDRGGALPG